MIEVPTQLTSMNFKIDKAERARFDEIARSLGLSTSAALKVLVKAFNDAGGFPFDLRTRAVDFDDPRILHTRVVDGVLVMPDAWRDEDDDD